MSRGAGRRAAPPLRVTRGSGKRRSARRSALPSRVTSRPAAAFCRTVTSRASPPPPRDITGCCPSAPLPSHRTPCRLLLTGEALITPPHNRPCTARRPAAQLGLLRHCSHSGCPRGRQRRLPGTKTQHFIYSLNTRLQSARAHSLQQVGTERPTGAAGTAPGATAVRHRKGQLQPPPEHCCRLGLHAASEPWAGFERTTKMPTVTLKRNRSSHESIEQRPGRELSSTGRCLFPSRARAQHHHPLAQPRLHIPTQGPAGHLSLATGAAALAEGRGSAQQEARLCCSIALGTARKSLHYFQRCSRSRLPTLAPSCCPLGWRWTTRSLIAPAARGCVPEVQLHLQRPTAAATTELRAG